jgi:hypothetical protein
MLSWTETVPRKDVNIILSKRKKEATTLLARSSNEAKGIFRRDCFDFTMKHETTFLSITLHDDTYPQPPGLGLFDLIWSNGYAYAVLEYLRLRIHIVRGDQWTTAGVYPFTIQSNTRSTHNPHTHIGFPRLTLTSSSFVLNSFTPRPVGYADTTHALFGILLIDILRPESTTTEAMFTIIEPEVSSPLEFMFLTLGHDHDHNLFSHILHFDDISRYGIVSWIDSLNDTSTSLTIRRSERTNRYDAL